MNDRPTARCSLARWIIGPPDDAQLDALLTQPHRWPHARSRVDGFIKADHALAQHDDATLERWFKAASAAGWELELEVGAIKEWSAVGADTFAIEAPGWRRLEQLGAPLGSIAMDEPLMASRHFLSKPDDFAVQQTADFIVLVRQNFPHLKIGDVEPYPTLSLEDHLRWSKSLQERLASSGVRGLDFYRIDPNWSAFDLQGGLWTEVKMIADHCRANELPFSLIYWAAHAPSAGPDAGSGFWHDGVLSQAAAFKNAGGLADQIVVQSWVGVPPDALPEEDTASFAGTVLDLARFLHPGEPDAATSVPT